jgi:ATP-dependent protease ClpP protease subunit
MRLESDPANKTIQMRGPVGDFDGGISADDFRDCLNEHAGQDVTIHLDSEGGVVSEGLAMYNAIMQHEGEVTIHIDTLAASIATVVCCAADTQNEAEPQIALVPVRYTFRQDWATFF